MAKTAMPPMKRFAKIRRKIYIFVIVIGLVQIFFPLVAYAADIFKNDVHDVYYEITQNVKETNTILNKAFQFCTVSPHTILNGFSSGAFINISGGCHQIAIVIATLLLLVDFFKKTTNFEWASNWENILIFLVKVIVVKQVVQNADTIIAYIYAMFDWLNRGAIIGAGTTDLLPCGNKKIYIIHYSESLLKDMWEEGIVQGWGNFFSKVGESLAGGTMGKDFTYEISWEAVHMFFPTADDSLPAGTYNYIDHRFAYPDNVMFQPTIKIIFMQPYFLVMKAIAYIIFVIAIGRVFELCIYTLFAPLPLATFAGEGSHDIAKNFIKTYIATVIQITVMIAMFAIYLAMNKFFTTTAPYAGTPLIQFIVLISLGLGVTKSGTWARRICGCA